MTSAPFQPSTEPDTSKRPTLGLLILVVLAVTLAGLMSALLYVRSLAPMRRTSGSEVTAVVRGAESTILKDPLDVAVYGDKFYVTDAENRRVVVFMNDGQPLYDFRGGAHGVLGSELVYPNGIDINSRGEVYVADSGSGKVVVFSETGRALRFLKLPRQRKMVLKPLALEIDEQDNIYVSEAKTRTVYQFDSRDKLVRKIGAGKLAFANGIAVRDNGDVYVADSNNQRILVFSQFGKLLQVIGHRSGDKSFLPRGLAFDKRGDLLAADTIGSRIVELNETGHEIDTWGSPGSGREQMMFPNGIEYADGLLYVVDRGNNRVVIWQHL